MERVAHQGLADLGYRADDRPVADRPAVVGRLAAVVGMPAAVVGRLAAVAHKHAGEPQLPPAGVLRPLLADGELLLLARAVCEQPLPVGVEPPQQGRVVAGLVLRFSDRNRDRTCSRC